VESSKKFRERVYGYAETVKQKKDILKEDLENNKMKECTFSPQIEKPTEHLRSVDEFLQDQNKFLQRKKDNIAKIAGDNKEKIKDSIPQHPKIDQNSEALLQAKPREGPVHERLYNLKRKEIPIEKEEKKEKKVLSQERRDLRLYGIAVKKNQEMKEKQEKEKNKKPAKTPPKPAIDPLVVQGFKKEFNNVISGMGLTEESKANYDQTSIHDAII